IVNSSGRSLEEQAKLEGHNLWRKKLQESFQIFDPDNPEETICSPEVQDLVEKTINDRANLSHDVLDFKPMLAVEYDEKKHSKFPYMVQPKLDGIRWTVS